MKSEYIRKGVIRRGVGGVLTFDCGAKRGSKHWRRQGRAAVTRQLNWNTSNWFYWAIPAVNQMLLFRLLLFLTLIKLLFAKEISQKRRLIKRTSGVV